MEPALVLGSHTVGLGVARALGTQGVPVVAVHYDERDMGHVSKYVTESLASPHPEDDEEGFVSFLLRQGGRLGRSFLVPSTDAALSVVSRHKEALEQHFVVACTGSDVTRLFVDKKLTYALAEEAGIAVPRTAVPRTLEDVERYAESARYPCLVKPSQGHLYYQTFRKKMVLADDLDELIAAYLEAAEAGFEVMLQEYIPGDSSEGVNYNSYTWDGEALVEFTAAKIRNAPRRTGSPCCLVSAHVPAVIEPGRRILRAMGFYGFACTEFKRDPRDGVYKLMEVNGRHNLSSLLAVRCGVNFPWLHYAHLTQGALPVAPDQRDGVYWIDILRDLSVAAGYMRHEGTSPVGFLRPYVRRHVFAVPDGHDPRPFANQCARIARASLGLTSAKTPPT